MSLVCADMIKPKYYTKFYHKHISFIVFFFIIVVIIHDFIHACNWRPFSFNNFLIFSIAADHLVDMPFGKYLSLIVMSVDSAYQGRGLNKILCEVGY